MSAKKSNLIEFEPTRDGVLSAPEICNMKIEPLQWVVEGVVPLEGVTMIVSPPKAGKSILALNIIVANAIRSKILGYFKPTAPFDTLYIDLEGTKRRTRQRIMNLLGNKPIPASISVVYKWPRIETGGLSKLYDYATYHPGTKLFIIDTYGKIQRKSKSNADLGYSYKKDVEEIDVFSKFCEEMKVSVILIHHTKKTETDDWVSMVSGTYGISGSVDTLLLLKRNKGEFQATLCVTGRDVEERRYKLNTNMNKQRMNIIGEETDEDSELTDAQRDIVLCLQAHGEPASPKELSEMIGKTVGSVKRLLANMVEDGKIIRAGYGKYCDRLR
jgi:hypothetical protein